jgi:hypothetical protein
MSGSILEFQKAMCRDPLEAQRIALRLMSSTDYLMFQGLIVEQVANGDVHVTYLWQDGAGNDRSWSECVPAPGRVQYRGKEVAV